MVSEDVDNLGVNKTRFLKAGFALIKKIKFFYFLYI